MQKSFSDVITLIQQDDPRYGKGAYFFVREALDHTLRKREEGNMTARQRHVCGQELLEGIRSYALEQYGPMAKTLFDHWNVKDGLDFGKIVFHLVEYGIFGRTDEDSLEDFANGYDFAEAFEKPFLPKRSQQNSGSAEALEKNSG